MSTSLLPNRKLVRSVFREIKQRIEQDKDVNPERNPANIIDVTDLIDEDFLSREDNISALNRLMSISIWKLKKIPDNGAPLWVVVAKR